MRELQMRKKVAVKLVGTADMEADILTNIRLNILDRATFDKHRRTIKNLAAT